MKILGIDPGSRRLGYGIVALEGRRLRLVEAGVVHIRSDHFQSQLLEVVEGLDQIGQDQSIDAVALEGIFYAYNPQSVLKLAQFRGAIALRLLERYGKFHEYTPLQVKRALTGNGKATKEQVAFMVRQFLGIRKELRPFDMSDALAVAITHAQRLK
ncbi:MAG: crossover junction endodeoxyribonuclease RuvC [Nitratiruptor sp.]|nr:crossover junction endodeoxyribonuclease RuvC [Nitratiruptor sp.]NPA82929.1 crossover junction endodeoxyribonuclease RuvC [Campylobacterota bacterium]